MSTLTPLRQLALRNRASPALLASPPPPPLRLTATHIDHNATKGWSPGPRPSPGPLCPPLNPPLCRTSWSTPFLPAFIHGTWGRGPRGAAPPPQPTPLPNPTVPPPPPLWHSLAPAVHMLANPNITCFGRLAFIHSKDQLLYNGLLLFSSYSFCLHTPPQQNLREING